MKLVFKLFICYGLCMETSVTSLIGDFTRATRKFNFEYFAAYPNTDEQTAEHMARQLRAIFGRIRLTYETIARGYEGVHTHMQAPHGSLDLSFDKMKIFWLFHDTPFISWSDKLQSFIVKKNDSTLSEEDYILLFYISLQTLEVRNFTQNIPVSMLHDMFLPVADSNLAIWKKNI
jgi:hypothetical protein